MDRGTIRGMVEDLWRAMIPRAMANDSRAVEDLVAQFDQRIKDVAAKLDPIEAAAFVQAVEAEREGLLAEYRADPYSVKQRLGVAIYAADAQLAPHSHTATSDLGNLAVRTAVRATVWEAVWAAFRAFR